MLFLAPLNVILNKQKSAFKSANNSANDSNLLSKVPKIILVKMQKKWLPKKSGKNTSKKEPKIVESYQKFPKKLNNFQK